MEKFAGYGFNKSHSAAYAMLSYQTAWLKAHHPAAFMAAVLSSYMEKTDKVVTIIDECASLGLEVQPPDVNASMYRFTVASPRTIRYGLGAVKGVGEGAVEAIIGERERTGPFRSIADFCRRLDLQRVNRRTLEALIRAGCLDGLGANRATLMHQLPAAMQLGEQNTRALAAGQDDLFGLAPDADAPQATPDLPVETLPEWSEAVRLAGERETLGLYLTGHPIAEYADDMKALVSGRIADIAGARPVGEQRGFGGGRSVTVGGLVLEVRRRGPRVTLLLDDRSGRLEVSLFEELYQQHRDDLAKDAIVIVEGMLRFDDFIDDWRLTAKKITPVDQLREQQARRIVIRWQPRGDGAEFLRGLESALQPFRRGGCAVLLHYGGAQAWAAIALGEAWNVRPTRELVDRLTALAGRDAVRVVYGSRVAG
jgi:DNA polymerase-3 subunit alpha